jgi:pantoate--beta-alanine ligase
MRRAIDATKPILAEAGIEPEYFEAVSVDTLDPVARLDGDTLVAIAARVGGIRLIDNVIVSRPPAQ